MTLPADPPRLRRSILTVPAINSRALEKIHALDCDAVIFDLEDSVAPARKADAREALRKFFAETPLQGRETIIRINPQETAFAGDDLDLLRICRPDAVLLPKVEAPGDVQFVADFLSDADVSEDLRIWAMIETPRGILNAAAIAHAGHTRAARLDCFVLGLNDLRKQTAVPAEPGRTYLVPWMMQVILAARAYGLDVIDSVHNGFKDLQAFADECDQGRAMGFDGKMLIHPAQIADANRFFGPDDAALAEAQEILAVFADSASQGLNVINANGRMIERLHLDQAKHLIAKAQMILQRKSET